MACIQCIAYHRIASHTRSTRTRIRLCASIGIIATYAVLRIGIGTLPAGWVTNPGHMAHIKGLADYRIAALTVTALAAIGLRASISIRAACAIQSCGMRALSVNHEVIRTTIAIIGTRARITVLDTCSAARFLSGRALALSIRGVTFKGTAASDRIGPYALPALASVALRTGRTIVTNGSIIGFGVGTRARRNIALPGHMTLIRSYADDRITARTLAILASIGLSTGIQIIAIDAILFCRIGTLACGRIANARTVALIGGRTHDGITTRACAALTFIRLRAGIGIIAACIIRFGRIRTLPCGRIANPRIMALILGRACYDIASFAGPVLAFVRLRTFIGIIAACAIRFCRVRALACGYITNPRIMALILGRACDRIASGTLPALTLIGLGAGIGIIAGRAIGFCGMRAAAVDDQVIRTRISIIFTRARIAGGDTTLVAQFLSLGTNALTGSSITLKRIGTRHQISACASAILTGIRLAAGIAIITKRSIIRIRIRTSAGTRIANTRHMALIKRRANYRIAANTGSILTAIRLRAGIGIITA